jgi:hypothetical protein
VSDLGFLVQQVTSGVERLGRRDELTAQLRRIDAVDKACDQLVRQLAELTETEGVARGAGFAPPLPEWRDVATSVHGLRRQLAEDDVDREFAQGVIDSIGGLIRAARDSISSAWREYVVARIPSPEGFLVLADTFSAVEGASAYAARLRTSIRSASDLLQRSPTAAAVVKVNELAAEIPQLLQQLVGAEPQVRAFAEQLGRGGAGIEALTPSVLRWMKDSGFLGSFKVVPGRPAGT